MKPEGQGSQVGKFTKHCTNHKKGQSKTGSLVSKRWRWEIKPTATYWKWTKQPKVKRESLIRGETKCVRKKEERKHATQIITPNRKHRELTDGADSLKTHDHLSRWTAITLYRLPSDWLQPAEGEHHRFIKYLLITCDINLKKSLFTSGPRGISDLSMTGFLLLIVSPKLS